MGKKCRKIVVSFLIAFGLFVNCFGNIHTEINNPTKTISTIQQNDPIDGDH
ncbi:hypothetical protein [Psychrobacillus sp. FJAT-21963]|uniref:hypothetical protein n=1 Tax=Psychrobacillus sp. FJAT-21963 TaxID=1712028 RepID=UPI0012E22716|nr:hypothetical protein [Psychrobacillus sp. FJAT-21963]